MSLTELYRLAIAFLKLHYLVDEHLAPIRFVNRNGVDLAKHLGIEKLYDKQAFFERTFPPASEPANKTKKNSPASAQTGS